ncbi:DUF975 family protein [Ectobacillus antri]|uniref:DUF975 family protein n=1 Tax=Ectobacillus antri TaxID=2486280 RepID=A0ABT6H8Z0_9BACI|nr:DUF975 family protein [Ectobacillus antri]MDG4658514.1 DUF975 family protein [Ectobacillus antri]MDG5754961.1 DUF975 family protein [Ectobacillus antri]
MIRDAKMGARSSLDGRWKLGVGATFIYIVCVLAFAYLTLGIVFLCMIPFIGSAFESVWNVVVYVCYGLGIFVISSSLVFGFLHICMKLARGERTSIYDIFRYLHTAKQTWTTGKAVGLVSLYTCLWSLLLIVPGMIKAFSYSMTYFILLEKPHYTIRQAMEESNALMKRQKRKLFLLILSFTSWILLCILTCGIACLWIIPYICVTISQFYLKLSQTEQISV